MTTPISESTAAASQPKAESFVDWFHVNSRVISFASGAVLLVAFGVWFVQRTSLNASINADKMLQVAKQSLNSGNAPLAEADLKKVVDKYSEKPAGTEAGVLLAQMHMDKGDYKAAIATLQDVTRKAGNDEGSASAVALLGDANMQLEKPADAAAFYQRATNMTPLRSQKNYFMAKAARAYLAAGSTAAAREILEALANQSDNDAAVVEARIRLGELEARLGTKATSKP